MSKLKVDNFYQFFMFNLQLDYQKVRMCYNSWKAYASHANTYRLVSKYNDMFLFKEYL